MNGMADNEDEDTFFDEDFPDIADDEFQRLEQNAISFTQQEQAAVTARKHGSLQRPDPPKQPKSNISIQSRRPSDLPGKQRLQPEIIHDADAEGFDDSILDEHGLPLIVEEETPVVPVLQKQLDETSLREQWRSNRFGQGNARPARSIPQAAQQVRNAYQPVSFQSQAYPGVARGASRSYDTATVAATSTLFGDENLHDKIEELEASLRKANEDLVTRRGEIANIRAQKAEVFRNHQRELSSVKKVKQEEAEKHKTAIDALNAEKGKIVTKIQLLKHELEEESRKVKSLQKQLNERPLRDKPSNVKTTPKRNANSLRDGFDDEDLMVISPVKSGRRSKPGTPTANRKRKLPSNNDVNIQPLVLRPSDSVPEVKPDPVHEEPKHSLAIRQGRANRVTERHLRLLQQVLTFRPSGSQEVLVERLVRFTFPSEPKQTLSSIVVVATAKLSGQRLPGDLLQIFIDLWARALQEKYYVCIKILVEVVNYILELDLCIIDADIIRKLLPVAQSTAEINAMIRFRLLAKQDWLDNPENKPKLNLHTSTTDCLELIFTIASLITDNHDLITIFWRITSTDFILMMLNACQAIPDIMITLQLLATSILPTTFGNICLSEQQTRMETYITDRVLYLLWEQFKTLESEPTYARSVICQVRLEALTFVSRLTMGSSPNPYDPSTATNHGTTSLAHHATAIARLVRSIYDEVDTMYLLTPTQPLHAQLVNRAVHILHFILNSPVAKSPDFNLQLKLAGTNGGAHKHRVVLTRLAFSEGVCIDKGITDETVRMATELLEDSVTPDEAEDLTAAFGGSVGRSGGGGRGSTQG